MWLSRKFSAYRAVEQEGTVADMGVTTIGGARALVENHLGLLAYGQDCVRVRCRRGAASIRGSGLALREVRKDALIITGRIDSVELEREKNGK